MNYNIYVEKRGNLYIATTPGLYPYQRASNIKDSLELMMYEAMENYLEEIDAEVPFTLTFIYPDEEDKQSSLL